MKRIYIKPLIEELPCEDITLLTGSDTSSNLNGPVDDTTNPNPNGARTEDPFFDDEEEF